jgi:hypothetical protein
MRRSRTLLVTALLGIGAACVTRDAKALGPIDVEAAAKVGYGTNPFGGGYPNPLGLGLGVRGGVSLLGFYGGLGLMYYVGGNATTSDHNYRSVNSVLYGIEAGYGAKFFDLVTLRGQLGLGNFTMNQSGTTGSGNPSNLYLEPGLTALASFGILLVGVDANVLILPGIADPINGQSSWDAAFTVHAQGGVKF